MYHIKEKPRITEALWLQPKRKTTNIVQSQTCTAPL
nr:MAG TPA: hypothetical protein [Caudoviricetes sp.]